jgi:hypothetical protein
VVDESEFEKIEGVLSIQFRFGPVRPRLNPVQGKKKFLEP